MPTDVVLRRIVAVIIDGIILFILSVIVLTFLEVIGVNVWNVDSSFDDADFSYSATETFGGALVSGGLALLYKVYQEGTYNGQTIGKRALSIRAVKEGTGAPISMEEAFLRGLFWQAPFTLAGMGGLFWLIGVSWLIAGLISLIASPTRQRLGDRVAGTVVIRDVPVAFPYAQQPPQFAPPTSPSFVSPQAEAVITCAYCQSRIPRSQAQPGIRQGGRVLLCPNCGAPLQDNVW
jgi:uncharacterized RDD family membrane protein YckC